MKNNSLRIIKYFQYIGSWKLRILQILKLILPIVTITTLLLPLGDNINDTIAHSDIINGVTIIRNADPN